MPKSEITAWVKSLSTRPGVYRMLDASENVIYVGKARNLRNRVSSYFQGGHDTAKTRAMVNNIHRIEVTVTGNEIEALLLESNLIKEYRPRYNVVFRDDKSYPYLYMSTDQAFPRLSFYRGARKGKGRYFGPYPSASASRRTLGLVQKLFKLRQCDDSFFKNRQRPCLQYQIKRCSAPCVDYISQEDYAGDIRLALLFLDGKNEQVIASLEGPMLEASEKLEFEEAARYRDQIFTLRQFQESQHIIAGSGEADIIACSKSSGQACVQLFIYRGGRNLGNKTYFQSISMGETAGEIIDTFIKQYYLGKDTRHDLPATLYVSHKPEDSGLLQQILSKRKGRQVSIRSQPRGEKGKLIKLALDNARLALKQRQGQSIKYRERLEQLREFLGRDEPVTRIECFDISHMGGENTVASCVVFGLEGAIKADYRRFNIDGITPGDDYEAMAQVIRRHYTRLRKEEGALPDLLLLDGGKGQVSRIREQLAELQLDEAVSLLGIAKGPTRKAGRETLILSDGKTMSRLQEDSVMLHLLQEIRDEAHRFAITGHRQKRKKKIRQSSLENIEGIGNKRRQRLILHFGGWQGIQQAGVDEIAQVPGISRRLAQSIYDTLHNQ